MKEFKLKQLFDLQMGKTPKRKESKYWKNGVNDWISISDLSNSRKYINQTSEKITDIAVRESGIKVIPKNTVVMSFKLSIGKVAITEHDMYSNEAVMAFHDRGIETILPEYLYYLLSSKDWNEGANKAVKGITLNKTTLSNIKIKIHKASEQAEIIKILSNIEGQISYKKDLLIKYDYLIKSRFVEMFGDRFLNDYGWNTGKLGEFVAFNNGKAHEQVIDKNGKYILVTSRAIASDFVDVRRTNALLFPLYKNDIVMVMSDVPNGQALAKCQLIEENNKYTLNQRICCFNNFSFNSIFLFNLLNRHPYFLSFNDGNSQTNLRKSDILNCDLIVPPIELQNSFAEFAEHIDKLKFVILKCQKHKENLYFVYNNYKYGS
jgi:type I restriction enzyme S subunit